MTGLVALQRPQISVGYMMISSVLQESRASSLMTARVDDALSCVVDYHPMTSDSHGRGCAADGEGALP
jgi:hypothetical protein